MSGAMQGMNVTMTQSLKAPNKSHTLIDFTVGQQTIVFDGTKGNQEYLRVTSDSTRIYVNDDPAKGIKGGFAVGGFDASKGTALGNFLNITKENYLIGQEAGIKLKSLIREFLS